MKRMIFRFLKTTHPKKFFKSRFFGYLKTRILSILGNTIFLNIEIIKNLTMIFFPKIYAVPKTMSRIAFFLQMFSKKNLGFLKRKIERL